MTELYHIPWSKFDFPRYEMVDFCFSKMEAFGDRNHWHINYNDFGIESDLLMFFRDNNIKAYKRNFDSYDFGECDWEFLAHNEEDIGGWAIIVDYEDFKIKSIRFLKDRTVVKQWIR